MSRNRRKRRFEYEMFTIPTKGGKGGKNKGPKDYDYPSDSWDNPWEDGKGEPDGTTPPVSEDDDAFKILRRYFESLGIVYDSEIETVIREAMLDGYGPDQINLIMPDLEQTQAFRNRFTGYHDRVKNGYNAISIGEYLQLENMYHRIMEEAGLPAGFYDDPSDFGNWIASNVSPDEVQNRVRLAVDTAQQVDPTARNLMARFYGLTTGDVAAYFLDQGRALPVIERQFKAANVASWASRAGLNVAGMSRYESLVDAGITPEQAAQSYGTIASLKNTVGGFANIYGESYTQEDAEDDVFFGQSDKRRRLVAQETATFQGSSKGATGSAKRQSY